ncbi:hypothetical protein E4V01_24550 [Methylorubrum sp. Q1]|uniref:hypothetical protein n=1 Tax=Methylorubrum sp. Q1 TaxID=2562453 RepID=UPI0010766BBB|nr:hypothetical protein [Methylorubrum sp. Q1]TFZ54785.1 hypothetical protein E4V01_24550 [Methylorubrum sp. Q1]
MRYRDLVSPPPRDPFPNEASLTVHIDDEAVLQELLWDREDVEIVERAASVMPNSSLVYVRCEGEEAAEAIWEAWLPYHPSERKRRNSDR